MAQRHITSKRSWVAAALAVFAAAAFAAPAGSAPSADPQCGDVVASDVVLTSNLVCSGDGLIIAGFADVTLDLHGHSISGSGAGTGITISPSLNENPSNSAAGHVTVQNGSVRGFDVGVRVEGNALVTPGDAAVQLDQLFITGNGNGVVGAVGTGGSGPDTAVTNSTIARNQSDGVLVALLRPFRMINDQVRNNGGNGISAVIQDSLSLLQNSFVAHNGGSGAVLRDTVAAISGNTFLGNGGTGLSIRESVCAFFPLYLVSDNVADQNGAGGMSMAPTGMCSPAPAPPSGSGNAAKNNAVFQCVLIVCAKNRGQA
jgi:hypothetical protein